MKKRIVLVLSVAVLVTAVAWLWVARSPEPLVAALAALIGIVSQLPGSSASAVSASLDNRVRSASESESERTFDSVAVLPFVNLIEGEANDFFSEGITEELIAHLSKIRSLKVISRTSVMALRDSDLGAKEIGEKLSVPVLVEGSVRRSADAIRITAKLVEADSEHAFWMQTFERPIGDLYDLQNDLAVEIAHRLNAAVTEAEMLRLQRKPSATLEAYELYLLGWYHWYRWTQVGWAKGVEYLEQAIAAAPEFADAHAAVSEAYTPLAAFDIVPRREAWKKVRAHALQALDFDEESAVALSALGMEQAFQEWNRAAAEQSFRRAVTFDGGSAVCRECYGVALLSFGDFERAEVELNLACELDPLHPVMRSNVGHLHIARGDLDGAVPHMELAVSLEPKAPIPYLGLGEALLHLGDLDGAIRLFEHSVDLAPLRWGLMDLGHAYAIAGREKDAEAQIERLVASPGDPASYEVSVVLAALGRSDESAGWLDRAVKERSYLLVQHGLWDPRLVALIGEGGIAELRAQTNR